MLWLNCVSRCGWGADSELPVSPGRIVLQQPPQMISAREVRARQGAEHREQVLDKRAGLLRHRWVGVIAVGRHKRPCGFTPQRFQPRADVLLHLTQGAEGLRPGAECEKFLLTPSG